MFSLHPSLFSPLAYLFPGPLSLFSPLLSRVSVFALSVTYTCLLSSSVTFPILSLLITLLASFLFFSHSPRLFPPLLLLFSPLASSSDLPSPSVTLASSVLLVSPFLLFSLLIVASPVTPVAFSLLLWQFHFCLSFSSPVSFPVLTYHLTSSVNFSSPVLHLLSFLPSLYLPYHLFCQSNIPCLESSVILTVSLLSISPLLSVFHPLSRIFCLSSPSLTSRLIPSVSFPSQMSHLCCHSSRLFTC